MFQLKTQVRSADHWAGAILDKLQEKARDPEWETFFVDEDDEKVETICAELFSILTTLMSGQPLTLIKGEKHGDGWQAFNHLFDRYNPRTPARALMAMRAAMNT